VSDGDRLQRMQDFLGARLGGAWEIEQSPMARIVVAMRRWGDGTSDTVYALDNGYAYGHRDTAAKRTVMETEGLISAVVQAMGDWVGPD